MNKPKTVSATNQGAHAEPVNKKEKRAYSAPFVRSAEPLEAVAAVCADKGAGGPGKVIGPFDGCGTPGS
ncbi:MAG: hypothetical protein ACI8P9_004229 [Parasphingorhabdus sp.]|jgi:hypothetical protein